MHRTQRLINRILMHYTCTLDFPILHAYFFYKTCVNFSRVSELGNPPASVENVATTIKTDDEEVTSAAVVSTNGEECDSALSALDRKGVAVGCFVLARCLQLGQAVARNEQKAHEYYTKATRFDKQVVAELHDKLTHGQL